MGSDLHFMKSTEVGVQRVVRGIIDWRQESKLGGDYFNNSVKSQG